MTWGVYRCVRPPTTADFFSALNGLEPYRFPSLDNETTDAAVLQLGGCARQTEQ